MKQRIDAENPRISVIIPVYNAERGLACCLDAVCGQTLREIEIICVNDGSADHSAAILQEHANNDKRIRIVTLQKNMGAAVARNRGMAIARGDYLGFVDSDDYPESDFYEKLYSKAVETNADVAKGNYKYWGLDGAPWPVEYSLNERIREYKTNFSFAFCSAIYRRSLVFDHKITFPEDLIDIEDPIFSLRIAMVCNAIAIDDNALINIRINKHSATFGAPDCERITSKFKGLSRIIEILNASSTIEKQSYAFVAAFWFKGVSETSLRNKTGQAKRIITDNLYKIFSNVKYRKDCAAAFEKQLISELFLALASEEMPQLSAYVMGADDKRKNVANHLRLALQKKRETENSNAVEGNKRKIAANYLRFILQKRREVEEWRRLESAAGYSENAMLDGEPLEKVCVVIPIYRERPNAEELASARQCFKILGKHRIVFVCPESLDVSIYKKISHENGIECIFERFSDAFFESTLTYSKLMLDPNFYDRFSRFEYLLVYQLDCWVFHDELERWCGKAYDYIGAPWFEGYDKADADSAFLEPSGNGGFSLRKIASFIRCLRALKTKVLVDGASIADFFEIVRSNNEDGVIIEIFPKIDSTFTIAPTGDAMRFSFEVLPERLYALVGGLPFGCHAFAKYSPEFWSRYIDFEAGNALELCETP